MNEERLKKILNQTFGAGILSRDGANYSVKCPFCKETKKDKKKFVIHLKNFKYHCWVCEAKGANIINLLSKLKPELNLNIYNFTASFEEEEVDTKVILPDNIVPLYENSNLSDVKACRNYLFSRGLSNLDIARWRMLTVESGDLRRYIIIPSFDSEGNLNYYISRSIDDKTYFKYKNAKVPKKNVIFNEIDINWDNTIILVEGVFDAINCPENTIPLLGSSLPPNSLLINKLKENYSNVIVALDADLPGKTHKICQDLILGGCNVYYCFPKIDQDFGSMTKSEVLNTINNSKKYNYNTKINYKISTIKSGSLL
jgi:DNA primase